MPEVHLIDATYELFRAFFGAPPKKSPAGREVGACRGLVATLAYLVREGATHVGCATDHVIRSFRNQLFLGYKTEEGMPVELASQFHLAEDFMRAMGFVVWPMVDFEADDALATAAARFSAEATRVHICTPDKDLAQCVRGDHVVMLDRKGKKTIDEAGVIEKFGVPPSGIPDFLALVGDTSDGYPGITGFGKKTAAILVSAFGRLEDIPDDPATWPKNVRGAPALAGTLASRREEAMLYKLLATLRTDVPMTESFADMEWKGALPELRTLTAEHGFPDVCDRVPRWQ